MDESDINMNFDLDELDVERILEMVKSDLADEVLNQIPNVDIQNFDFYELRSKAVPLSVSLDESPTLKTEAVRSRTQLKQQLMRDQELFREQERRRRIEEATKATKSIAEPIPIPLSVSSVELPESVLQVSSGLQNPTKYHILAKQKNQVLQYLNNSAPEDFVSKFDAQKASQQLKQQQQLMRLELHQGEQVEDQRKQQLYQQKQLQQQQRILQRKQVQGRKQLQLQYREQWYKERLEEIKNLKDKEKLEQVHLMEFEQRMHHRRQQRQIYYFRQQQREAEMDEQQLLKQQQQLEIQQLLHQHLMEKQQLQQQFQLERQQLHQQQERLRLQQQLKKQQRHKQLQKQVEAEAKAEEEAHKQAQAQIRARLRGYAYVYPHPELARENQQPIIQEQAQAFPQEQLLEQGRALLQEQVLEEAQALPQEQLLEQAQALPQEQVLEEAQALPQEQFLEQAQALPQEQDPEQKQEQQPRLLSPSKKQQLLKMFQDPQSGPSGRHFRETYMMTGSTSPPFHLFFNRGHKASDDILPYDLFGTMSDLGADPDTWGTDLYGSFTKEELLKLKTDSCPSDLHRFAQELSFKDPQRRDRLRKNNHNIIERRRRSNINDRIRELAALLPKANDEHYDAFKDCRQNKGNILKSSVEYIKLLKHDVNKLRRIETNNKSLRNENDTLASRLLDMPEEQNGNEACAQNETWTLVKPDSLFLSILRNDYSPINQNNFGGSNQNNPGGMNENNPGGSDENNPDSSQPDRMEEDTDKDETC